MSFSPLEHAVVETFVEAFQDVDLVQARDKENSPQGKRLASIVVSCLSTLEKVLAATTL